MLVVWLSSSCVSAITLLENVCNSMNVLATFPGFAHADSYAQLSACAKPARVDNERLPGRNDVL